MKYKFSNKIHDELGMFGVEFDSLAKEHQALFEINSDSWTPEEVQEIIDKSNALTGDELYRYQVEGGHLYIIIDVNEVYFYDTTNEELKQEDFKMPFSEFITFMTDFKKFIEDNS